MEVFNWEKLSRAFHASIAIVAATMRCAKCKVNKPVRVIHGGVPRSRWCAGCVPRPRSKHTYDFVRETFAKAGCVLLAKEYLNNAAPLPYLCRCGRYSEIQFSSFQRGTRCQACGVEKRRRGRAANRRPYPIHRIRQLFRKQGCVLLADECVNLSAPMQWTCSCGNRSPNPITLNRFLAGHRCRQCGVVRAKATRTRHRELWSEAQSDLATAVATRRSELADET